MAEDKEPPSRESTGILETVWVFALAGLVVGLFLSFKFPDISFALGGSLGALIGTVVGAALAQSRTARRIIRFVVAIVTLGSL